MIWYACYGSNMDSDRFIKYIQGGEISINGKIKTYKPCITDKKAPRSSEPYLLNRRFFFAKESPTWDNHGVAFISKWSKTKSKTFAKLYLISRTQFSHLFAQENGRLTVVVDYDKLFLNRYLDFDFNFYNRIILIDQNHKGYPILTFTNKYKLTTNRPLFGYAKLIFNGLQTTHKLEAKEAFDYLTRNGTGSVKKDLVKLLD
jgi:hypothetical protein